MDDGIELICTLVEFNEFDVELEKLAVVELQEVDVELGEVGIKSEEFEEFEIDPEQFELNEEDGDLSIDGADNRRLDDHFFRNVGLTNIRLLKGDNGTFLEGIEGLDGEPYIGFLKNGDLPNRLPSNPCCHRALPILVAMYVKLLFDL